METRTFKTTILKADEDKYLTQSANNINIEDRIVCKEIALGCNDNPDNWKEITLDEANEIEQMKNGSKMKGQE